MMQALTKMTADKAHDNPVQAQAIRSEQLTQSIRLNILADINARKDRRAAGELSDDDVDLSLDITEEDEEEDEDVPEQDMRIDPTQIPLPDTPVAVSVIVVHRRHYVENQSD